MLTLEVLWFSTRQSSHSLHGCHTGGSGLAQRHAGRTGRKSAVGRSGPAAAGLGSTSETACINKNDQDAKYAKLTSCAMSSVAEIKKGLLDLKGCIAKGEFVQKNSK